MTRCLGPPSNDGHKTLPVINSLTTAAKHMGALRTQNNCDHTERRPEGNIWSLPERSRSSNVGQSNPDWVQIQGVTAKEVDVSARPQEDPLQSREARRDPRVEPSPQDQATGICILLSRHVLTWLLATYTQV